MTDTTIDGSRALDEQLGQRQFLRSARGATWIDALRDNSKRGISLRSALQRIVDTAETFYVTPDISDFLAISTRNTPPMTLHADLLPAMAGFVLFEHPLPMPPLEEQTAMMERDLENLVHRKGELEKVLARLQNNKTLTPAEKAELEQVMADMSPADQRIAVLTVATQAIDRIKTEKMLGDDIAAFGWMLMRDTSQQVQASGQTDGIVLACFTRPQGPGTTLFPVLCYSWHFGMTQVDLNMAQSRIEAELQGKDVWTEINREHWTHVRMRRANYFMGLLAFLKQRIMVAGHPQPATRGTRKRVEEDRAWTHEPLIRVVEYRRRQVRPTPTLQSGSPGTHPPSVRVIRGASTGGFWSHYWTKKDGYVAKWLMPFETPKNRPDLPLRAPRATVNVVKR